MEGYYKGDDGLLRRKCDGTCDTCPEHCWTGKPIAYFDGEEPLNDWEDPDIPADDYGPDDD